MNSTTIPGDLRTERLYLRSWRKEDAALLRRALEANAEHLGEWIPAHVAAPAPLPELGRRLAGFAGDFQAGRSWRYGIFSFDGNDLFGEISLFPRSADGRVPFASADRLELGYWLIEDATGRGYATEAARAMLSLATRLPGTSRVEIRCDRRNVRSAAVPRRLGFRLTTPEREQTSNPTRASDDMVWVYGASTSGV